MKILQSVCRQVLLRRGILAAFFAAYWLIAVSAFAGERPAAHVAARQAESATSGDAATGAMYVVDYPAAKLIAAIQAERHWADAEARSFLIDRVKGPAVLRLETIQHPASVARIGEAKCRGDVLAVSANRAGHEQIAAMLAAFRKFGVAEYAITVRFLTMREELLGEIFPDSTSTLLAADADASAASPAIPAEESELPLERREGVAAMKTQTIIEENSPLRFRVLDKDAAANLLTLVNGDRRSNVLCAPLVTSFSGKTALVSDLARSRFVVGAIPLPEGGYRPKTRDVDEGTLIRLRPVAKSNGDVRLDFAASFSKIENVTAENLKLASNADLKLQIPRLATLRVDGGVVLKPGQSAILAGIKRLSESRQPSLTDRLLGGWNHPPKREFQVLVLMLRVEPYQLPGHPAPRGSSVAKRD
jgi:hypothetical protein